MKLPLEDFEFRRCEPCNADEILTMQSEVLAGLTDAEILRNTPEQILRECLQPPHLTIGAWHGNTLAAFSMLYLPCEGNKEEDLSARLENVDIRGLIPANHQLVIVKKEFRGNSLQDELARRLESYALESGVGIICATVSPKNPVSSNSLLRSGYTRNRTLLMYS